MIKVSIDSQVMQSVMSGVADQLKSKIDLNMDHVKKLCKEKYGIKTINGIEHKGGNMAIFNGQIACKMDFEVRFPISVLITTKEGSNNTLPESKTNDIREEIDALQEELDDIPNEFQDISEELDDIMGEELDDLPEDVDYITEEELEDIPEELEEMRAELDDLTGDVVGDMPEVLDDIQAELDMIELKEEHLIEKDNKEQKNIS